MVENSVTDGEVFGDECLIDGISVVGSEDDAFEVFVIFDQDGVVDSTTAEGSGDLVEEVDGDGRADIGVGEDVVVLGLTERDEVVGGAVFVH